MNCVIIIDGRSGSGKTTLAERLSAKFGAELLRLDSLYPGWDGLAAGSRAAAQALQTGGYRRYDWELGDFAEWNALEETRPLVIEGCGRFTSLNLAAAHEWVRRTSGAMGEGGGSRVHTIWLECAAAVRKERALARDGDMFRPHWEHWAAQESAFFAQEKPIALAAEIVHVS